MEFFLSMEGCQIQVVIILLLGVLELRAGVVFALLPSSQFRMRRY